MNRGRLTRRGFTLAEAMIAMVILSFATAAVILPFATGATMNAEGAKRTIAAKLAADKLEEITYSNVKNPIYLMPEVLGNFNDEQYNPILTDPAYGRFGRLVDYVEFPVSGEMLYLVTVTVTYDNDENFLKMSRLFGP